MVNWEEHNTGIFRTHVDNIGNTELQLSGIACLLFPVLDYYKILRVPFILGFTFLDFMVYSNVILYIDDLIFSGEISLNLKILNSVMKNTEGEKRSHAIRTMIPMIIFILAEILLSNSEIFKKHTVEIIFMSAMVYGFYTSKLIIATMTKVILI